MLFLISLSLTIIMATSQLQDFLYLLSFRTLSDQSSSILHLDSFPSTSTGVALRLAGTGI